MTFLNWLHRCSSLFKLTGVALFVIAVPAWVVSSTLRHPSTMAGPSELLPTNADAEVPAANAVSVAADDAVSDVPSEGTGQTVLQVGDRLSLSFYERLLVDEEQKWLYRSRGRRPPANFYERTELTGQYEVQQDGTITVPLLGALKVAGRSLREFESDGGTAFERRIGPLAFINAAIEHQPVYVLGPVKNPGTYKYTPGLTILHLVALSGGFDRATMDLGRMLETARSFDKKQKSANGLKRLWARMAALTSERDGGKPVPHEQLIALAGEDDAKALVEAEVAARALFLASRRDQTSALVTSEAFAKSELEHLKVRQQEIESNIALRSERLATFENLLIARPVVAQASAELAQVKEHLAEVMVSKEQTHNRIDQLASERSKLENESRAAVESEIISLGAQIADAQSSLSADAGVLEIVRIALADSRGGSDSDTEFEIVRLTPQQGRQVLKVSGTDIVLPGDLVRISLVTDRRIAQIR
jgi:polysaccharide biosynthesis/export protein ExoF